MQCDEQMIFYHYTALETLDSVLREGLTKGDVPITATADPQADGVNAGWFTTSHDPSGHGLGEARPLTDEERRLIGAPPGSRWKNKRAVRITVKMPLSKLKHWPSFARKHVDPACYRRLSEVGGGKAKAKTWYLSFNSIPPEMFAAVDLQTTDGRRQLVADST